MFEVERDDDLSKSAIVVHPILPDEKPSEHARTPAAALEEAVGLAEAIRLNLDAAHIFRPSKTRPSTLIGAGQVEQIAADAKQYKSDVIIINHSLSALQQRNLERETNCKVIDRTALILEIFGERAQTREGQLQVELAALEYQKGRLVRSWTHLERQRGGLGFVGGPGESQIELDRRMIADRIVKIKKQLDKVIQTRTLHRKQRDSVPYPTVALAGYTNAGKSTLFNRLTGAKVMAEDQLFATLDPTIRRIRLPSGITPLLSDTVGFISNLPTELIAAFRATLEEVVHADVILHVRDISCPDTDAQKEDVEAVLKDVFGNTPLPPVIEVWNKCDALNGNGEWEIGNSEHCPLPIADSQTQPIQTSALTGEGIEELRETLDHTIAEHCFTTLKLVLPSNSGDKISWLYNHGHVIEYDVDEEGKHRITARLTKAAAERFTQ